MKNFWVFLCFSSLDYACTSFIYLFIFIFFIFFFYDGTVMNLFWLSQCHSIIYSSRTLATHLINFIIFYYDQNIKIAPDKRKYKEKYFLFFFMKTYVMDTQIRNTSEAYAVGTY